MTQASWPRATPCRSRVVLALVVAAVLAGGQQGRVQGQVCGQVGQVTPDTSDTPMEDVRKVISAEEACSANNEGEVSVEVGEVAVRMRGGG